MIDPQARPPAPVRPSDKLLEAAIPPLQGPKVASLDDFRRSREVYATLPSGNLVKIRPTDLGMHALAGDLPMSLREITRAQEALEETLQNPGKVETPEEKKAREAGADYFLSLIKMTIVEPDFSRVATLAELMEILIPADTNWLLRVANGQEDRDAEGKRLWGREPLSRWKTFRELHRCPENCEACNELRREFEVAPAVG